VQEQHQQQEQSNMYNMYIPSKKIWLNGHLVDRTSLSFPKTSYGILFYRFRHHDLRLLSTTTTVNVNFNDLDHCKEFEFLLGLIPQRNFWTVFKGMPNNSDEETPYETAMREFEEESSLYFPYRHWGRQQNRQNDNANNTVNANDNETKKDSDDDIRHRHSRAIDWCHDLWPPPQDQDGSIIVNSSRNVSSSNGGKRSLCSQQQKPPFLSTVLHGVTSSNKLLEIYLLPDPDMTTTATAMNSFSVNDDDDPTNDKNDSVTAAAAGCGGGGGGLSLDITKFDVDKVIRIDGGYMKGQPEIVQLRWLTKQEAVDVGVVPVAWSSSSSNSSQKKKKQHAVKVYKSQIPILIRAEELLHEFYHQS
jgi:hypothetical protein